MENIEAILGTLFGAIVLIKAIYDAGKLPAGPARATNPAEASPQWQSQPAPQAEQSLIHTTPEAENTAPLDAEEVITIKRVNEIKDRIEARRAALSAMGLEITNLDKW